VKGSSLLRRSSLVDEAGRPAEMQSVGRVPVSFKGTYSSIKGTIHIFISAPCDINAPNIETTAALIQTFLLLRS
jgi:hypothetical protein